MFLLLALSIVLLLAYAVYGLVRAVRERKAAQAWERHCRERDERWAQMLAARSNATPPEPGETLLSFGENN